MKYEEKRYRIKGMKKNRKTMLVAISVLLGLGMIYYLASVAIPRMLVSMTRAAPAKKISLEQSLVLGEKILCKANGEDKCKVNVFVLDGEGKGVDKKRVELISQVKTIMMEPAQGLTNGDGRVSFEVSSVVEGQAELTAVIEGIGLGKGVRVTFRN
jgi:hypothetical protein